MIEQLARHWWVLAVRGVAAIVFGIIALAWPGATLAALVLVFGAYALVDGIFSLVAAFRAGSGNDRFWGFVLAGIAGVVVGLIAFASPATTALAFLYLLAGWALVTGVFEIVAAVRLRKEIEGEWMLGLSGALSVLWGILLAAWPGAGLAAIVWLIGVYAIIAGIVLIALSFRLRGLGQRRAGAAAA
jgi:uncharacterized membrane protein HdeD (DUF308 family)